MFIIDNEQSFELQNITLIFQLNLTAKMMLAL